MTLSRPIVFVLLLAAAATAAAHTRSESWSEWRVSGQQLSGIVTLPAREVTRIPEAVDGTRALADVLAAYLGRRVAVTDESGACRLVSVEPLPAAEAYVRVAMEFRCTSEPRSVSLPILFEYVQGHSHFARRAGSASESLLVESRPRFELGEGIGAGRSHFLDYLGLGTRHILSGPDHLAFLIALLLAAATWRNILIAVTGFTIGHSITLSLAVTGLVRASAPQVEAFIGFTIALVAAETVALRDGYWRSLALAAGTLATVAGVAAWWLAGIGPRGLAAYLGLALFSLCYLLLAGRLDERLRRSGFLAAVAVLFGLIHGLGFAGFLLETGLPRDAVLVPLAGFNLGVEFGQIGVVAIALALAWLGSRYTTGRSARLGQSVAAAALCGLGIAWFAGRSLG